jgi:DNA polymerase/3'-5' exonuclease PolX
MGICKLSSEHVGRRIDIRFVTYPSYGAAMLYFTGSGKFNKIMRYHANQRGYTLNEYGLFHYVNDIKGAQVHTYTEQDIFRILNFVYLKPEEREF